MQKQIVIDMTHLSGGQQHDIMKAVVNTLESSARRIKEDAVHYSEGPAKDDMLGWAKAATDQVHELALQAKDQKITWGR